MLYLNEINGKKKLLLHCCCAPCSSYVFSYLKDKFDITAIFYNPNIMPKAEHDHRLSELKRLVKEMNLNITIIEEYDDAFLQKTKGYEKEKESGLRCDICYRIRLEKTARIAKELGFDCFTTTLSISPYKDADKFNEIGKDLEKEYGIDYLYSNFKKNDGYKKSIELSRKHNLYRQNYCGCIFSTKN